MSATVVRRVVADTRHLTLVLEGPIKMVSRENVVWDLDLLMVTLVKHDSDGWVVDVVEAATLAINRQDREELWHSTKVWFRAEPRGHRHLADMPSEMDELIRAEIARMD